MVYEIEASDPIVPNKESVAIERFTPNELKRALSDHPEDVGDAYQKGWS